MNSPQKPPSDQPAAPPAHPGRPVVFIVSAPSGSGKTTLCNRLLETVPELYFSVSYTTRPPRTNERQGREYCFVSRQQFERMIAADEFLEHANVYGNYYGTARRALEEARRRGQDLLLDIDVQGERQIKRRLPEALSIFILPPSRQVLESRLRSRHDDYAVKIDSEQTLRRRLEAARKEIENYPHYDYIVVNDRLPTSVEDLVSIVLSERALHSGRPLSGEEERMKERAARRRLRDCGDQLRAVLASFDINCPAPPKANAARAREEKGAPADEK